jgi:DMATS type aromatic prenyltransferase
MTNTDKVSVNHSPRASDRIEPTRPTTRELAIPKLTRLAGGLGLDHVLNDAVRVLDLLTGEWTDQPASGLPRWSSDITDDGTPFEFSVAFSPKGPELRLLVETHSNPHTARASWEAGLALNERLLEEYDVDLSRFDRIAHLFAPLPSIPTRFTIWHAAVLRASGKPAFKVYLNPHVVGRTGARALVERAVRELRLPHAARFLTEFVPDSFDAAYFSVDLGDELGARTKIYLADAWANQDSICDFADRAGLARRGELRDLLRRLTRDVEPHDGRPIQLCLAFRDGDPSPDLTVHVPVRSYVESDEQALARACDLLDPPSRSLLRRGVEQMAQRSLDAGRSLVTYAALRRTQGTLGVTVYLSPELYSIAAPRSLPVGSVPAHSFIRELGDVRRTQNDTLQFGNVLSLIDEHRRRLAQHPFIAHVARDGSEAHAREIARRMAFFVMGFQDVLRLVSELTTDPALVDFVRGHQREDQGHDAWYLHDIACLGVECDLRDVFSADLQQARDTIYTQVSDVIRSTDDRSRVAVVLALEAAGAEYFEAMIGFLERLGMGNHLRYFARSHQHVEQAHEVFETEKTAQLAALSITQTAFEEAVAVVDRTFETMEDLGTDLLTHMSQPPHRSLRHGKLAS